MPAGALDRMYPKVTPRSPLEETMAESADQLTGLVLEGSLPPIALPIASAPITKIASFGPPMFMASAEPYFANAAPMPIVCASSENAYSAAIRLWRWLASVAASVETC